ncbi:MAG: coiled-coil domain-containing protein mad1 [Caeruleum heppii]|nr:MAG: coiled-coil domain-containing protein mad1 [Caeruleum heppii]
MCPAADSPDPSHGFPSCKSQSASARNRLTKANLKGKILSGAGSKFHIPTADEDPPYDFLTGGTSSPPPMKQTLRQSQTAKVDHGNEELRAQIKALQYELSTVKQERELTELRHDKEIRDVRKQAESDFKRAQASEGDSHLAQHKYDALAKELREVQDRSLNEKAELEKQVRSTQEKSRALQEEVEEVQSELTTQERHLNHQLDELRTRCSAAQLAEKGLRDDYSEQETAMQALQQRLSLKESEVGGLESEVLRLKAQTGDADTLNVIKRELSDQVTHIKKLEGINREQAAELKQYRKQHKSVEVVEEEKRGLEGKLRLMDDLNRELSEARLQRQILEDERRSWTTYLRKDLSTDDDLVIDSPEALAKAFVQERVEKVALMEKMGHVEPELSEKEEIIKSLEMDKVKLRQEMDRLRSGGAGDSKVRSRLERQRTLAIKEIGFLRAQLKTFDAEETTFQMDGFDEQKAKRITELEGIVDNYRTELQTLSEELKIRDETGPAVSEQAGLKRAREEEPDERLGLLSRKNRKLQDEIASLHQTLSLVRSDLSASNSKLSTLTSSTSTPSRILELRSNPTSTFHAIRTGTLTSLRTENAALLAQLTGPTTNGGRASKVVPISALENARAEIEEAKREVAEKEKRMTRLKQIWSAKSLEFREAVASILGYRMDFMPNGRVRLTSLFPLLSAPSRKSSSPSAAAANHPSPDDATKLDPVEESIIFDGENGTMKVSGGPESRYKKEIKGLIRFWVEERGEIPCFLAALTLEGFERRTRAEE